MSVGTKTKREKLAEREDNIVTAASQIFHDRGMRAAKMSEIASAAGIAEGTLYLYFKNKEALFARVVTRHWEDLTSGAAVAVAAHPEPQAQLEALGRYTLRRIIEDWKLFELSFVLHYPSDEGARDFSDRKGYVWIFDGIVQRGIDRGDFRPEVPTRLVRDLFFGTMEYATRSMLSGGKEGDEEAVIAMLMSAMGGVLRKEEREAKPDLVERLEAAIDRLESRL